MQTEILVATIGAIVSIFISIIGAILTRNREIAFKNRELKEKVYQEYINTLDKLTQDSDSDEYNKQYATQRNKLLLIASGKTIKQLIVYEDTFKSGIAEIDKFKQHNRLLRCLRKDLSISNKKMPKYTPFKVLKNTEE